MDLQILFYFIFVVQPGSFQVSDADRLLSFSDSYSLGIDLMRGRNQDFFEYF